MKRDMDLVRLILLKIEEEHRAGLLHDLSIGGYDNDSVAYHCQMLHEAGFLAAFTARYADNTVLFFSVGPLTWEGNEFLDRIRDDSIWSKTKRSIKDSGLPMVLEAIVKVSGAVLSSMIEGAVAAILEGN